MLKKILTARCRGNGRDVGVAMVAQVGAADATPQPRRAMRAAHAGEVAAEH